MKKKYKRFIRLKLLFNIFLASAVFFLSSYKVDNFTIYKVDNLNYISNNINNFDENTLVIFDVTDTLLRRKDQFFNTKNNSKNIFFKKCHNLKSFKNLDQNKINNMWYQIKLQASKQLVDKNTPALIKKLQKKNVKVIALTKMGKPADKSKKIFEDKRINNLLNNGIDFRSTFPNNNNIELNYIEKDSKPIFKKGVLFSNSFNKGKVLGLFLDKIKWTPTKVIFVDDIKMYLNSVAKELQKRKINFVGLHYKAAEKFKCDFDKQLFDFQINHFIKHKIWLNDNVAKSLI